MGLLRQRLDHADLTRWAFAACLMLGGIFVDSGTAFARCEDAQDLLSTAAVFRHHLACQLDGVPAGGAAPRCIPPALPRCAAALSDQITQILLGDGNLPVSDASPKALRCQRQILDAGVRFAQKRLAERARGKRNSRAGRALNRSIERGCAGVVLQRDEAGHTLPRVGGSCAFVSNRPGLLLDTTPLSRCLRATLEGVVDDLAPAPLRPNIVLILTDDQRFDTLDVMPVTQALRDEGISFRNAFVTNPVCTPSRASILSGRYSKNNHVRGNGAFARFDSSDTIARWLHDAGYTTALLGKYLNNSELLGLEPPPGWDEWKSFLEASGGEFYGFRINDNGVAREFGDEHYSTDWLAEQAVQFVRQHSDRPFFLLFAPFAPHGPATPARRHQGSSSAMVPHRPPSWAGDTKGKPAWVRFSKKIAGPQWTEKIDAFRQNQLETLRAVDEAVEQLLETLERSGLTDNTVVVFSSDHGFLLGEHWLWGKFSPYEESIRVPYILRYPRRYPRPQVREEMVLNIDLAPTFMDLAGLEVPDGLDGASLGGLLDGAGDPWREEFLIETTGEFIVRPSTSVRTDRFKYIETQATAGVKEELYNLVRDPYERENLASQPAYKRVRKVLRERLERLRAP